MMSMRSSLSRLLASTSARKSIVNRVSRCNGVSAIVRTLSSNESITVRMKETCVIASSCVRYAFTLESR